MSNKERVLHTVLFEVFALMLMIPLGSLVGGIDTHTMTGVAIFMSLVAMAWNYTYNYLFDKIQGSDRNSRTVLTRIAHGIGFEAGLLVATLPLLMMFLNKGFMEVLLLEITMVVFFLVYAIAYNWVYDTVKNHLENSSKIATNSKIHKKA
ncbi:PACE efflux transporter [Vibrio tapetis subsp. quintayensis]|uniref:PACE efflux transporter n=1 Tax=Vibrio tapetis TaxID=52443 RepID=UPI0025B4EC30|nr:PACE efflux transporter [Vibrio tapetis]MDN3680271.1 PACE efflux transporter [Vibrio tapetis subsp. quintayensis]